VTEDYDKVQAGERVKAFLDDEYVKMAFGLVAGQALFEFKNAKTDDELRRAQALLVVTDNFGALLRRVVEEGQLARNAE
jgi:hypothetical protein